MKKQMTLEELRQSYEQLPSSNVSDALDALKLQRRLIVGLKPVSMTQPRMVGWAYTVRHLERHPDAGDSFLLATHSKVIDQLAEPGDVLVVEMSGRIDACSSGAILVQRGKLRGMKGFLIDGGFRDANEASEMQFPIFCKDFTPAKSGPHMETVETKGPVNIAGTQVRQGDLLIGDESGIVVVAKKDVYAVYEAAYNIYLQEEKQMEMVKNGATLKEAKDAGIAYAKKILSEE